MKNLFLNLAFAVVALTNAALAGNASNQHEDKPSTISFYGVKETAIYNPEEAIQAINIKELQATILEDQLITESTDVVALPSIKSVAEVIAEDKKVIESQDHDFYALKILPNSDSKIRRSKNLIAKN